MSSTASAGLRAAFPSWLTYDIGPLSEPQDHATPSSDLLVETVEECLPLLIDDVEEAFSGQLPPLEREKHIRYLHRGLNTLPAGFAALDASRPWVVYWCLMGLSMLGVDVAAEYRDKVIATLRPIQNSSGGFGGGFGQYSHLATTYASLLSLAMVGGEEAFDLVDRHALWQWLSRLKQSDGGFAMSEQGERDMRAPYCAMVAISLLNLPLTIDPSAPVASRGISRFTDNLAEWIASCQTYEGGISSAPGGEAHGSYVFCALACLCILGEPHEMMGKYLNMDSLLRWLTHRQHAPEGGLAGRANKVVDGCYSHWLGGCWSLAEAAVTGPLEPGISSATKFASAGLFNREGLIRYILCCCQGEKGGLRDKPSKPVDSYHSCYNLAGLSSAQNHYFYTPAFALTARDWRVSETDPEALSNASFQWQGVAQKHHEQVFNEDDRVALMHPIYIIPSGAAERMKSHFLSHELNKT